MIKTTLLALVAAAGIAGAAVPAYADTYAVFGNGSDEMQDLQADSVLRDLRANGVNATSVEQWGGLIRAYVVGEDGTQTMQFFTPGTLAQVNI